MKVEIWKLDKLMGTVSYEDSELKVDGDENFKQYVRQLKRRMPAEEFVKGLPTRLRSYIYAKVVEE